MPHRCQEIIYTDHFSMNDNKTKTASELLKLPSNYSGDRKTENVSSCGLKTFIFAHINRFIVYFEIVVVD